LRFGIKLCRHEEDAREVLQDTLLAAARGLRSFRSESRLSTWLYAIARSFCVKHRRKSAHQSEHVETLSNVSADNCAALVETRLPDDELTARRIGRALEHAISSLEPKYREVLLLCDVEGLKAREAAEVLELGVDVLKSRLHRARATVRESVAPLLAEQG
jgi:RNA polymerase sigma-70 factor (ECF subfamily)